MSDKSTPTRLQCCCPCDNNPIVLGFYGTTLGPTYSCPCNDCQALYSYARELQKKFDPKNKFEFKLGPVRGARILTFRP